MKQLKFNRDFENFSKELSLDFFIMEVEMLSHANWFHPSDTEAIFVITSERDTIATFYLYSVIKGVIKMERMAPNTSSLVQYANQLHQYNLDSFIAKWY